MGRTGRPRGFDRTEALDAALKLFWQQGYEATSLNQLTEAMGGISTASFYGTFKSKEALFREALKRYLDTYGSALASLSDESLPPGQAISLALHRSAAMQTTLGHPAGCLVGLGASGWSAQNAELAGLLAAEREKNRRAFRRLVERGVEDGTIPEAGAAGLASLIDALLLGLSVQARDGVPLPMIDAAIDRVLQGWN